MSAALALLGSLLWGVSDFLGGSAARRMPVTSVILVSQLFALAVLLPIVLLTGAVDTEASYLAPAAVAGLAGIAALGAFYRALAIGTMGIVAPIASLGVIVPLMAGLLRGEQPSRLELIGIAVAIGGVVLASGPELSAEGRGGTRALLLAAGSAVGFGVVLLLIADASKSSVLMTLLTMRLCSATVLGAGLAVALRGHRERGLRIGRADLPLLCGIGLGDAAANAAYGQASASGLVSVTAVLASLYPVVTVLLARRLFGERLRPVQTVGVVGALAGVALLALGGTDAS